MADFDQKLTDLVADVGQLQADAARKGMAILEQVRKELAGELAGTPWETHHINDMKEAVKSAMDSFSAQYGDVLGDSAVSVWDAAIASATDEMSGIALPTGSAPAISTTQLEILQGYSADLVTGLAEDGIKKINSALIMGLTGGKPLAEVMAEIGKNVSDPSIFKTLSTRLETIARTELARINNNARQARLESLTELFKKEYPHVQLYKQWIHSGKPKKNARRKHRALNGTVVKIEDDFPGGIPYPHAPGLSASETVNCGCSYRILYPGMKGYPESDKYEIYDGVIVGTGG